METSAPKHVPGEAIDPIRSGVVTFFNDAKGFGFIKDLQTQESVFIHVNQLSERIAENDKVSFEVQMGHKGANAINVKKYRNFFPEKRFNNRVNGFQFPYYTASTSGIITTLRNFYCCEELPFVVVSLF